MMSLQAASQQRSLAQQVARVAGDLLRSLSWFSIEVRKVKLVLPKSWYTAPPPLERRARWTPWPAGRMVGQERVDAAGGQLGGDALFILWMLHSFHGFWQRPMTTVGSLRQRKSVGMEMSPLRKSHSSVATCGGRGVMFLSEGLEAVGEQETSSHSLGVEEGGGGGNGGVERVEEGLITVEERVVGLAHENTCLQRWKRSEVGGREGGRDVDTDIDGMQRLVEDGEEPWRVKHLDMVLKSPYKSLRSFHPVSSFPLMLLLFVPISHSSPQHTTCVLLPTLSLSLPPSLHRHRGADEINLEGRCMDSTFGDDDMARTPCWRPEGSDLRNSSMTDCGEELPRKTRTFFESETDGLWQHEINAGKHVV